jgi:hypothetical protein
MRISQARTLLRSRAELNEAGLSNRAIAAKCAAKTLRKVHPGWFVDGNVWEEQYAEGRHALQIAAVRQNMRGGDTAFVGVSAAVAWELPLFRLTPAAVHIGGTHVDGRATGPGLARHEMRISSDDIVEVDGIRCTALDRTVYDVLRSVGRETGIAIADAALRRVAWDPSTWTYDEEAAALWRELLLARTIRNAGARGVRRARAIIGVADGRAQLPGESVSRLYLLDLGFAAPRLQVPIPGPRGRVYYVDFGLDDVAAWGEFDGKGKYVDPRLTQGADPRAVLAAEKERQDWIHGTTHRTIARWGSSHIASASTLAARLRAFHLRPPG